MTHALTKLIEECEARLKAITQGKWTVFCSLNVQSGNRGICSSGYQDGTIETARENERNAEFIAAAPETQAQLIQMLKIAIEALEFYSTGWDGHGCLDKPKRGKPDYFDEGAEARVALAKLEAFAEGAKE